MLIEGKIGTISVNQIGLVYLRNWRIITWAECDENLEVTKRSWDGILQVNDIEPEQLLKIKLLITSEAMPIKWVDNCGNTVTGIIRIEHADFDIFEFKGTDALSINEIVLFSE